METLNSQIIDLQQRRRERLPPVVRLAPELDGHGALLNIGFGPSELIPHPVLAWALNEDDSCVGMILHCGTLAHWHIGTGYTVRYALSRLYRS